MNKVTNSKKESSDGLVMVIVIIIMAVAMFLMGGCGTIQGAASDIELVSGAVREGLEPTIEKRRQARVDRAAELVIAEKGRDDNQ